ncbi:MAG: aminopeptidase P family protein [Rhizobiales bacterium]|nr:aminopeptidase P family protein [Hyphomicrobiales bacterium]NRB13982.1 aminopeptidase P family protein [Hyphomicrobiales bacterium]
MTFQNYSENNDPSVGRRNIAALRRELMKNDITGFIIPRVDAHMGENVAPADERLKWLTGFGGSWGQAIVKMDRAGIFVDGRYTIQVRQQVDIKRFEPYHLYDEPPTEWLSKYCTNDDIIAIDPWLHTSAEVEGYRQALQKSGAKLLISDQNIVDLAWDDRPELPQGQISLYPEKYAGVSAANKLASLAKEVKNQGADAAILSLCDGIAWAFNIRGSDIQRVPVAHSFALISATGEHKIFISGKKLTAETRTYLANLATIYEIEDMQKELKKLGKLKGKLLIDKLKTPHWFKLVIEKSGGGVMAGQDPTIMPKACKNDSELNATRQAHIRDGKPMAQFLRWCDDALPSDNVDEIHAAIQLEGFRKATGELKDISFDSISGAGENGAICHYHVNENSSINIPNNRLYLIDSGGQYIDGTTDITRTIAVGTISDEAKRNYTLVLKGMIAISITKFPIGTTGAQLDALARQFLWADGKDYDHGTGHGVGVYLDVHEGPARISKASDIPLQPGMILSNEPGYYKQGEYGIRIENLLIVCKDKRDNTEKPMLYFETITLAPIDKRPVEKNLMSQIEIDWFDKYHREVWKKISPQLDKDEKAWLKQATSAL